MNPLKDAALRYAHMGWAVVPLFSIVDGSCDCRSSDCTSPGKHPRTLHGMSDATSDSTQVEAWWDTFPTANIGVVAGKSGLLLLDIDPRNGGVESVQQLSKEFGQLPKTLVSQTGGGGVHYLFKRPKNGCGNRAGIKPGVDIKCDGGYFVAAPSNHVSGKSYEWLSDIEMEEAVEPPPWLLTMANNGKATKVTLGDDDPILEGGRDNLLTSFAGTMRRRGMSKRGILAALRTENERCRPPLDDRDLQRIAHSIGSKPPAEAEKAAAELIKSGPPQVDVEIITGAGLLAEPDEPRDSHFRERFYYPAFGASCGDPRSGKGTFLLRICFCLSMGLPLGPELECVKRAPAVFFTNEDTRRRLRGRLRRLAIGAGIPFEELKDLHLIAKPKPALHLPENLDSIKKTLDKIGPKFIVLDGLSRISQGRDLNLDVEMQPVVNAIEDLRDQYQASVELICHTTKNANGRGMYKVKGAGCVPAAADHLLLYERDGKDSSLSFSESRDDDDWEMSFIEEDVGLGTKYSLSAVMEEQKQKKGSRRDEIPEIVVRLHAENRRGVSYDELAAALDITPGTAQGYVAVLVAKKRLRIVEGGGRKNPTLVYPMAL